MICRFRGVGIVSESYLVGCVHGSHIPYGVLPSPPPLGRAWAPALVRLRALAALGCAFLLFLLLRSGVALCQEVQQERRDERSQGAVVRQAPSEAAIAQGAPSQGAARATLRDGSPTTRAQVPAAERPIAAKASLTPATRRLRDELRRCLMYYYERPESTSERGPWGTMHAIIGFGVDTALEAGDSRVNAIGWLCWNRPCLGYRLFEVRGGRIHTRFGPGYQGHDGQFLKVMALARVPKDFVIQVDGQEFTIADVVRQEQETCESGTELTFKLIGLAHYLDSDATWRNRSGELWSIERLIREELSQPVIGAACGGTHRLTGFGYAVRKRQRRGEPITGQWARAQKYVQDYVAYTYALQNEDGSFSTRWFEGRGNSGDIDRQLETTGHTLEWLLLSVPDDQLSDPRLIRAVEFLNALMWEHRDHDWPIGPKGHAIHALVLYDERVFGAQPGQRGKLSAE